MPPMRESRHLWVGNIPDSITEEKLVEYFQRYGRIDSVKILAKRSGDGGQAAFVDFVDIRCAIKAHETPSRLGDRELRTDYNEPATTTLTHGHGEQTRRYERGGRGPADEGYSSRQNEGYQGNYAYKDDPPRRDYDRIESGERNTSRVTEGSPVQYQQSRPTVKAKGSGSGQSESGTALSGSGSDSSDSGDSDSESDSDSSASETSKGIKKTRALQIRNLSSRSTDATIREGLYHEFKKHGDVGHIKVMGRDSTRYATVYFRRHEDVVKAMENCRGKMFLGLEMELTPCEDDQYEGSFHHYRRRNEAGSSSFGNADDVYMFNATRTIFVGNIERNATSTELKRMFERYGEIVDIDIKKQGSNAAYAFIQYLDITHAVEAKKQMNHAVSGRNKLKVGFGKGMPTSTIWIGGVATTVTEQMLERYFQRYGHINRVGLDLERSYAMVTFENLDGSTAAHNHVKGRPIFGKRVRVDYASRESQHFFYDHLARTGQGDGRRYEPSPPPPLSSSYRPRNNKSYEEPAVRSRTGVKQDNRGSKYPYDHGYDRGPSLNEVGRRNYDDYYRGPPPTAGYESDEFGQELREYNVTRERERAREREQDRRQEPPRRRHHRVAARHEVNTESDGERYYSRGEHSDVWPGDSGKDRGSRESSVEPRDDSHRRGGDKRRDGDKRRSEDKRGNAKGRFEEQSEEDNMEPIEKQPVEKKEHREKNSRKKPMEPRDDDGKTEFYPTRYEKDYDSKDVLLKREREIQDGVSGEEGKMEESKGDVVVKEERVRVPKERKIEKAGKKMKMKDGKKKRKNKKSPVEVALVSVPSAQLDSDGVIDGVRHESRENIPQSRVEIPQTRVEIPQSREDIPQSREEIPQSRVEIPQSRVEIPQSRVEIPQSRVEIPQSRVEKRGEPVKEHRKARKSSVVLKSAVVVKNAPDNSDKERRHYHEERRPKSPSPEDYPEEHISRKHPEEQISRKHPEEHISRKHPEEHISRKNPEEHISRKHPEEHISRKYPEEHISRKHPEEHISRKHPEEHVSRKHPEEQISRKHPEEQISRKHPEEQISRKHPEEQISRKHPEEQISRKHPEEQISRKHPEEQISRKHPEEQISRKHPEEQISRKHPEEQISRKHPEEHISRKRSRSLERDGEHHHAKNNKHVDSSRHSNGDYDDVKRKKRRQSNEATPPPPPPPPPPNHSSKPKPTQSDPRKLAKDGHSVSSSSRESSAQADTVVGQSTSSRSNLDTSTFKPRVADTIPSVSSADTTKHVISTQASSNTSPTDSPGVTQSGNVPVPNSDDTLMELLRRHPVMWQGLLGLKNDSAAIQMHYVSGNSKLAEYSLPKPSGVTGTSGIAIPPILRIAQRMRMEASQLEGVTKRMQLENEHCLLLALPCGRDPLDVHAQTRALKNGFIAYLQQKLAAGIINIAQPGSQQASFVLHVFPPCEFSHSHLSRVAPNLLDSATDSGHLMVVVATV